MRHAIFIMLFLALMLRPIRAHAYIDLGLAGQLFQAAYLIGIAVLAFVLSPILFFWKQISKWIQACWRRDHTKGGVSEVPARDRVREG